jgi:hypothetical protein
MYAQFKFTFKINNKKSKLGTQFCLCTMPRVYTSLNTQSFGSVLVCVVLHWCGFSEQHNFFIVEWQLHYCT